MSSSDSDGDGEDFTLMYKASHFLQKDVDALVARYGAVHGHTWARDMEGEMTLEHTDVHRRFTEEFDAMLEAFVVAECPGMPAIEAFQVFLGCAKDTLEGRFMPLCMEDEMTPDRVFVESLLAVDDFRYFFKLVAERRQAPSNLDGASSKVQDESLNLKHAGIQNRK
jgi:hypothetical protein